MAMNCLDTSPPGEISRLIGNLELEDATGAVRLDRDRCATIDCGDAGQAPAGSLGLKRHEERASADRRDGWSVRAVAETRRPIHAA
jgi:hypothetical protein